MINIVTDKTYPAAIKNLTFIFNSPFSVHPVQNNNERKKIQKLQGQLQSLTEHKIDPQIPNIVGIRYSNLLSTIICRVKFSW